MKSLKDLKTDIYASHNPVHLDPEELADIEQVERIWQEFDVNRNGVLDRDEGHNFLRKTMTKVTG